MQLVYRRRFRIGSYDLGTTGELRPAALMGFLEDAAAEHAASAGVGFAELGPRGLMWVLSRYHLRLEGRATQGEELEVTTWPSGRSLLFATRDFEVTGRDGRMVARATSSWAVIDSTRKRPLKLSAVLPEGFVLDRRAVDDPFRPLPALDGAARELTVPVLRRDLDRNRHVNHAVYVTWGLEALPPELGDDPAPASIEAAYLAEARLGDHILAAAGPGLADGARPRTLLHRIAHADTGVEFARLRTTWR